MRRIVWSEEAAEGLDGISAYVEQFNPLAAQRLSRRLLDAVESLAAHPQCGRFIRSGVRELTAIRPYLVRYAVTNDEVTILRIRHGARRPD